MLYEINETHDIQLRSWVESANDPDTDFPIQNLPFGIFHRDDEDDDDARVGVAIGEYVLDLAECANAGLFVDIDDEDEPLIEDLECDALNSLMCNDPERWSDLRGRVSELLSEDCDEIQDDEELRQRVLVPMSRAVMQCPAEIGDYTDFYASLYHATNVGSMFRPDNPLLPNYKWIPIAYHGRASSIRVSGDEIVRPMGQTKANDDAPPVYAPCKLLDYELEVGFFVGQGTEPGETLSIDEAEENIFGLCLVNDWSARDIQKWEYQPLGPFLAKSFATTISPWVVSLEALAPYRCPIIRRGETDPKPLPYLASPDVETHGGIDITLEVFITTDKMRESGAEPHMLSRGSFKDMYWSINQMLAHHASNGVNLEPGDLLASGTVSGTSRGARGCLLELTWDGDPFANPPIKASTTERTPIKLSSGEERKFLQDGDEIIIRGFCVADGFRRIGFGECRATILPADE
ncbi:MAG: fumarylacetoacetase [Planctomycetes bacterium]|nr:fumarylacetoacetase [Planctomycetota bacterium]